MIELSYEIGYGSSVDGVVVNWVDEVLCEEKMLVFGG